MSENNFSISGYIIDPVQRKTYGAEVSISNGKIHSIKNIENPDDQYILPGFIDAHIHIESSMLVPYEFARMALRHGTVATISDPHEIANVMGVEGVHYMLENARSAGLKFHFGAPSCVPATNFETAGSKIESDHVKELLSNPDIYYLSEMMNYPGVLHNDAEVMRKIQFAKQVNKPIDGHAPGLMGDLAKKYIEAGITTDHECYTLEEALNKLHHGMKVIIREGSAAKNFETLMPLISTHPDQVMFCSDDKHPDDLISGHINDLVKRALAAGFDMYNVLKIACIHPIDHYKMNVGRLRVGDPADFIIIDHPKNMNVQKTYIDGKLMSTSEKCYLPESDHHVINNFNIQPLYPAFFELTGDGVNTPVIRAIDGALITEKLFVDLSVMDSKIQPDQNSDILKIAVVNRYNPSTPAIGFIQNFNLTNCAIASTVAHDSHNIIVVGTSDELICKAVNALIEVKGGLSLTTSETTDVLPLPVAGLMSTLPCESVGISYADIDRKVKENGCKLKSPFMTLSFMALLVIPKIKISDLGMFDAEAFEFY